MGKVKQSVAKSATDTPPATKTIEKKQFETKLKTIFQKIRPDKANGEASSSSDAPTRNYVLVNGSKKQQQQQQPPKPSSKQPVRVSSPQPSTSKATEHQFSCKKKVNRMVSPPPSSLPKKRRQCAKLIDLEDGWPYSPGHFVRAPRSSEPRHSTEYCSDSDEDGEEVESSGDENEGNLQHLLADFDEQNEESDVEDGSYEDYSESGSEEESIEYSDDFSSEEEESDTSDEDLYHNGFSFGSEEEEEESDKEFPEDLYIPRGAATVYDVPEGLVLFDPDASQIIDITDAVEEEPVPVASGEASQEVSDDGDEAEKDPCNSASESEESVILCESSSSEESVEQIQTIQSDLQAFVVAARPNTAIVLLKNSVFFNGILEVTLLAGHVAINGYQLRRGEAQEVNSARGFHYLSLDPIAGEATDPPDLANGLLGGHERNTLLKNFDPTQHAVLLLTRPSASGALKALKRYTEQYIFPEAHTIGQKSPLHAIERLLNTKFFPHAACRRPLRPNVAWRVIPLAATDRLLIAGGKNVGKSTTIEQLLNRALTQHPRVLLVDLDIGQPMTHLPQTLSATVIDAPLIGLAYLRPRPPAKALLFGDISVVADAVKYLRCVQALLEWCRTNAADLPWIVNTMGYHKGFGLELLAVIIRLLRPSRVVQIQHEIENFNFKRRIDADLVNTMVFNMFEGFAATENEPLAFETLAIGSMVCNEERTKELVFSASERRTLRIVGHLGALLKDPSVWFTELKPISVSLTDLKVISSTVDDLATVLRTAVLNGSLVYLCKSSDTPNTPLECFEIGLVRAVDESTQQIFLLTPLDDELIRQVDTLALTSITLPKEILLKQSTSVKGPLPYVFNTEHEQIDAANRV